MQFPFIGHSKLSWFAISVKNICNATDSVRDNLRLHFYGTDSVAFSMIKDPNCSEFSKKKKTACR